MIKNEIVSVYVTRQKYVKGADIYSEVHPEARLAIEFQRTLRIPDDGKD
jgi:hypothetical protein